MNQQLRTSNLVRMKTSARQVLGMRLSNIIKLTEKEFNQLVIDVESDPLFENLRKEKIVRHKRFSKTDFSTNFLELNENIASDQTSVGVVQILETKQEAIKIIKEIGIEKFKKYFLYNEDNISNDEIAENCGIEIDKIKAIIELLNEISIQSEFYNPSKTDTTTQIGHHKIASINSDGDDFIVNFFSPNLARGKYEINYDKLEKVKDKDKKSLIHKLELINLRKTNIHQILEKLVSHQKDFLNSNDSEKLKLLTQKMLSKEIDVDPSIICRIITNKSIELPSKKEILLKDFFCNKKDVKKLIIKKIIEKNEKYLSAEKIKWILKNDYKINIPRRSIAYYISELNKAK
ncbi:MAG: hypothetical protein ABID79_02535 [Elusimicrobiota bacterium]